MASKNKNVAKPSWPKEFYQPSVGVLQENFTNAEIRAEYARLYKIAKGRINRLGKSEFADSEAYLYNKDRFKPLSEIAKRGTVNAQLAKSLADLEYFISSPTSTISGQKAKRDAIIEALRDKDTGEYFVTKANYKAFYTFMSEMHAKYKSEMYDSEQTLKIWKFAQDKNLNVKAIKKDFDYWYKNIDAIEKIAPDEGEKAYTAKQYKEALESKRAQQRAQRAKRNKRKK